MKTEPEIKHLVRDTKHYEVRVGKIEDICFDTYLVINKETSVIEAALPNIVQAFQTAKKFSEWVDEETPEVKEGLPPEHYLDLSNT